MYDQAKSINAKCILNYFLSALHIFMSLLKGSLDVRSDEQGKLNCFPFSFLPMIDWYALAWNYKTSFKGLWSRQQNWSQLSFFKRISVNAFFFLFRNWKTLFFPPLKSYSTTGRMSLSWWKILSVTIGQNMQGIWFSYSYRLDATVLR